MTTTTELNAKRRALCSVLGEKQREYFGHMKAWFRKRCTKEEFDIEARKLLPTDQSHLHNEFFLAILNKCQALATFQPSPSQQAAAASHARTLIGSPSPPAIQSVNRPGLLAASPSGSEDRLKVGSLKVRHRSQKALNGGRPSFDHQFQPVDISASSGHLPDFDEKLVNHPDVMHAVHASAAGGTDGILPESCYYSDARDGMLPDASLVQGRLLVAAWEEGLEGAGHTDPEVTNLILVAAEQQVRSIVNALLMDRKGFKLMDSKFPNQIGLSAPDPWLRNSKRRRYADGGLERSSDWIETINLPPNALAAAAASTGAAGVLGADPPLVPIGKPTYNEAIHDALVEVACSSESANLHSGSQQPESDPEPISLFDLMHTLQKHKKIIPSHSVYAVNMERLISRLHHSSRYD